MPGSLSAITDTLRDIPVSSRIVIASAAYTVGGNAGWLRYTGAVDAGTNADVAVDATTGDITCRHDVGAGLTADASVGVSGVFDVSDAAYDTFGEIRADINSATSNWEWIPECVCDDFITTNTLITLSADTGVFSNTGLALKLDPVETDVLNPDDTNFWDIMPIGLEWNTGPSSEGGYGPFDMQGPYPTSQFGRVKESMIQSAVATGTFAAGATSFLILAENQDTRVRRTVHAAELTGVASAATASWTLDDHGEIWGLRKERLLFVWQTTTNVNTVLDATCHGAVRHSGHVQRHRVGDNSPTA